MSIVAATRVPGARVAGLLRAGSQAPLQERQSEAGGRAIDDARFGQRTGWPSGEPPSVCRSSRRQAGTAGFREGPQASHCALRTARAVHDIISAQHRHTSLALRKPSYSDSS